MGATSVTGTGPGESGGRYKPANQNCCGGGCATPDETTPTPPPKKSCHVKYNIGRSTRIKTGSSSRLKIC